MANKTISNLNELTTVSNSDVLLVETPTETLKVTKENLLKEVNEQLNAKSNASHTHDEYVTENELNSKGLATETFVTNKIAEAQLEGGEVNLSAYATIEYVEQEIEETKLQLSQQTHSHTNKTTLDKLTESSGGKLVFDGKEIGADIADGSITPRMTTFLKATANADIVKLNRALIASDEKFYYKQTNQDDYDTFNLFLIDVSDVNCFENLTICGGNVVRIKGISDHTVNSLKTTLESVTHQQGVSIGDTLLMSTETTVSVETLDVSSYKTMAVYIGQNAEMSINYNNDFVLSNEVKITEENLERKISKKACDFIKSNYVPDDNESNAVEYVYNTERKLLSFDASSQKMYCYKDSGTSSIKTVILDLTKDAAYTFNATNINRCRIAVFYNKKSTDLVFGSSVGSSTTADEVLYNNDALKEINFQYTSKYNSVIVLYLGIDETPNLSITMCGTTVGSYRLDEEIKITSDNIQDGSISKKSLAFEIDNAMNSNIRIPKLNNILTTSTKELNLIYEMQAAPNNYVTDSSGKVLNVTSDEFLALYYDRYVGKHEDGLLVTKTILGKDESGLYDLYEYDFIPPFYTDTILLSSGMHTYELSAHFGLAHFFEHYMQYNKESGYLSDGFEYLRKYIRIKVIAIINPWGWNQSPKTYGNVNGVNINRNFDYPDQDGNSVWEKFPVKNDEWNQKGTAPFSEAETVILRDWLLANKDALYWIDCHTGLNVGPWDNFIYYNSKSPLVPKIQASLSVLEDRIRTKYNRQNPTKELRIDDETSIRLDWSEYMGVPSFTIEQTPNNTLWGTSLNNESGDITEFAVTIYAYVLGFLNPVSIDAESWIKSLLQE